MKVYYTTLIGQFVLKAPSMLPAYRRKEHFDVSQATDISLYLDFPTCATMRILFTWNTLLYLTFFDSYYQCLIYIISHARVTRGCV